jgi:putative glutathione S-transferase
LKEIYFKADPNYAGRITVPVLWDKKRNTIVNNESADILRIFNSEFNSIAKNPSLDLYPERLRKQIDDVNSWVSEDINNGVYHVGFATEQDVCTFKFLRIWI